MIFMFLCDIIPRYLDVIGDDKSDNGEQRTNAEKKAFKSPNLRYFVEKGVKFKFAYHVDVQLSISFYENLI